MTKIKLAMHILGLRVDILHSTGLLFKFNSLALYIGGITATISGLLLTSR
jgi:hypothetical protein